MYIVRWLMGHPIIAIWFLGAIAILLPIGNSGDKKEIHADDHATKQENVVSTTDTTKALEAPSAVTTGLIESGEKKVTVEIDRDNESKDAEIVVDKSTNDDVPAKVEIADSNSENEVVETKITVDSTVITSRSYPKGLGSNTMQTQNMAGLSNSVITTEVVGKTSVEAVSATVESVVSEDIDKVKTDEAVINQAKATTEETPKPEVSSSSAASIQDLGQISAEEMLLMAREAYWNNGLDEASQIYAQLIELEPNVIEHKGELGNVYWRQGYPKKAAQLYSEIAIPMIEHGNSERVANMIGFIGLFYPDRAAEIHKRLESAKQ